MLWRTTIITSFFVCFAYFFCLPLTRGMLYIQRLQLSAFFKCILLDYYSKCLYVFSDAFLRRGKMAADVSFCGSNIETRGNTFAEKVVGFRLNHQFTKNKRFEKFTKIHREWRKVKYFVVAHRFWKFHVCVCFWIIVCVCVVFVFRLLSLTCTCVRSNVCVFCNIVLFCRLNIEELSRLSLVCFVFILLSCLQCFTFYLYFTVECSCFVYIIWVSSSSIHFFCFVSYPSSLKILVLWNVK